MVCSRGLPPALRPPLPFRFKLVPPLPSCMRCERLLGCFFENRRAALRRGQVVAPAKCISHACTGDLNIAKMKIVTSLGEKSWKSWLQGFANRTRGYMRGLLASPHRTFETYVQIYIEFPKTVLYTDFNTLYIPPSL